MKLSDLGILMCRPALFSRLLHKSRGTRSEWEYPFAAAGVNVTFMLMDITGLQDPNPDAPLLKAAGGASCFTAFHCCLFFGIIFDISTCSA